MQPKTTMELDPESFGRVRERMSRVSNILRGIRADPSYARPIPDEVGFQLTKRCNLRCGHCFQWSDTGFHHDLPVVQQRQELDIGIIERVMAYTRPVRSNLYLWGGEPLAYSHWDRLSEILAEDPRWTVLCTNGLLIEKRLDALLPISSHLACLISLDGFEEENDRIRGKGGFRRVVAIVDHLLDLKRRGTFLGEISIHCVIGPEMVGKLTAFLEFFEAKRVNQVNLGFPWYIPGATAERMDRYFGENFAWLGAEVPGAGPGHINSWHSYQFHLNPEVIEHIKTEMARIRERTWAIRVRFQPDLAPDEVEGFIGGSERPAQGRGRCLAVSTRIDVLADGRVPTCKLFPETSVGDLNEASVEEVWLGANARRARSVLARGLTPVCSKCIQLYCLHGM